jgi:hypothetical protein
VVIRGVEGISIGFERRITCIDFTKKIFRASTQCKFQILVEKLLLRCQISWNVNQFNFTSDIVDRQEIVLQDNWGVHVTETRILLAV